MKMRSFCLNKKKWANTQTKAGVSTYGKGVKRKQKSRRSETLCTDMVEDMVAAAAAVMVMAEDTVAVAVAVLAQASH